MDPKACLERAQDALDDGDRAECRRALNDYRAWRQRGGFEPDDGDAAARTMAEECGFRLGGLPS